LCARRLSSLTLDPSSSPSSRANSSCPETGLEPRCPPVLLTVHGSGCYPRAVDRLQLQARFVRSKQGPDLFFPLPLLRFPISHCIDFSHTLAVYSGVGRFHCIILFHYVFYVIIMLLKQVHDELPIFLLGFYHYYPPCVHPAKCTHYGSQTDSHYPPGLLYLFPLPRLNNKDKSAYMH